MLLANNQKVRIDRELSFSIRLPLHDDTQRF